MLFVNHLVNMVALSYIYTNIKKLRNINNINNYIKYYLFVTKFFI